MKIWHISDTHQNHHLINISEDADIVIHSGDATNPRDILQNTLEMEEFIQWYSGLPNKYRIYVGGNHDTSLERKRVIKYDFHKAGIIYLENESVVIERLKIWGSPITPSFGEGWAFNKKRDKCHEVWSSIPEDTDIIVTHGPAKGILDLTYRTKNAIERCGCEALKKRILEIQPKAFLFGHIHNSKDITNSGIMKIANCETIFSNGSCVEDGKRGIVSSHGNIIEI